MQLFGVFVALLFRLLSNSWNKGQKNISNIIILFQLTRPEACAAPQNSFLSLSRVCVCCYMSVNK